MTTTQELMDIWRGSSSYPTAIALKNQTTPFNLDEVENIKVWFVDDKTGEVFSKYALKPVTGHNTDDFVVIDAEAGKFGIQVQFSETEKWNIGIVRIEIYISEIIDGFSTGFRNILTERCYNVLPSKIAGI